MTETLNYQRYAMNEARARATQFGVNTLSSTELLAIAIGTPHSFEPFKIVERLISIHETIGGICRANLTELTDIAGIGLPKAIQVKSIVEVGHRLAISTPNSRTQIKTPAEVAQYLIPRLGQLEQEEVHTVSLDSRNRIIATEMIYRGCVNSAGIRVCEIFRQAVRNNASSIVLAHNHPSGDSSPSADDVYTTREVVRAGKLLDIETLDHLVIAGNTYTSLKERGLGFD